MQQTKICTNCILPNTFPGISFNDAGLCNHCQRYRGHNETKQIKEKYENKFLNLLAEHKSHSSYDVLMAYSGGKDSTYTMDIFINKYNLRFM